MNKTFLILTLGLATIGLQAAQPVIERYQPERDHDAVLKIVADAGDRMKLSVAGIEPEPIEKHLNSKKCITEVIRVDNQTVGFINYLTTDVTLLTFSLGRYGVINTLGVDKDHQHMGYGRKLLQHALATLKTLNTPTISIMVKEDNTNARALYQKEGFVAPPAQPFTSLQVIILELKYDVPADKLPKGNLLQQYPKTILAFTAATIGGLLYLKFKR